MASLFFRLDTTGEKGFEEFYTENEIDLKKFKNIGVIKGIVLLQNQIWMIF